MDLKELEARIAAMQEEYGLHIQASAKRGSALAAELASAALREQALRAELDALKAKRKLKTKPEPVVG